MPSKNCLLPPHFATVFPFSRRVCALAADEAGARFSCGSLSRDHWQGQLSARSRNATCARAGLRAARLCVIRAMHLGGPGPYFCGRRGVSLFCARALRGCRSKFKQCLEAESFSRGRATRPVRLAPTTTTTRRPQTLADTRAWSAAAEPNSRKSSMMSADFVAPELSNGSPCVPGTMRNAKEASRWN